MATVEHRPDGSLVVVERPTRERGRAHCVIYLVTTSGRLPLANLYRDCDAQHAVADAILAVLGA